MIAVACGRRLRSASPASLAMRAASHGPFGSMPRCSQLSLQTARKGHTCVQCTHSVAPCSHPNCMPTPYVPAPQCPGSVYCYTTGTRTGNFHGEVPNVTVCFSPCRVTGRARSTLSWQPSTIKIQPRSMYSQARCHLGPRLQL